MYIPELFREGDHERLIEFMRQNAFATMVSVLDGRPVASHLPLSIEVAGESLILRGHFARANPQWRALEQTETLVIFTGPHAYISPEHYEKHESVPTWNYLAVHAYGHARVTEGAATLKGLHELIDKNEASYRARWESLSERYREGMLRGVVGFEIPLSRVEGAAKLSQNKTRGERELISASLAASDDAAARATGEEMRRRLANEEDDEGAPPSEAVSSARRR